MDNLATIQKIKSIRPHDNAETLELADVLAWQTVVKKGEFKPGDLVIYVAIDTTLPEKPEFEFLRNKHFRIKPIRLRGQESAGICFPLSILGTSIDLRSIVEGLDVTEVLNIRHYEKPLPAELAGQAHGGLPGFLIMTDELSLRSYPDALPELWGRPYYITRKDDGASGTFFIKGGEFGVCSRRIHLKESETNGFWRMARKYNIENAIRTAFPNMDMAIQGECVGPGIQSNHLGLTEMELHVFNLFDIKTRQYASYEKLAQFCKDFSLTMVTTITDGAAFGYSIEDLVKLASEQKYPNESPAEGIVIRPKEGFTSIILKKAWSGKILNPLFDEEKKGKK